MRTVRLLATAAFAATLSAQVITTVAGGSASFRGNGGPAAGAGIGAVVGLAGDTAGNLIVTDPENNLVYRISPDGILRVIAGDSFRGYYGDNVPATSTSVNSPSDALVDGAGNVFIADLFNGRVRRISPDGIITTVLADLSGPQGIALDTAGNLYIAETDRHRIRKWSPNGAITTVAGTGVAGFDGDQGPATSARLNEPVSVAVDAAGVLFIGDWANNRIRRVSLAGTISTYAADLAGPSGLRLDGAGNLYFTESTQNRVRRITPDRTVATVIAEGLNRPRRLAFDAAGNLYITDSGSATVKRLSPDGTLRTIAGTGSRRFYGDGGPGRGALLYLPVAIAADSNGNLFIADSGNDRVRKLDANGIITTVASGLNKPSGVAVDQAGNVYIADTGHNIIRKLDASGNLTTVATPSLNQPAGIAIDASGNLYIADTGNNLVRRVAPGGEATTVGADLKEPSAVAFDSAGNVYIADTGNQRVVRVSGGTTTLVAGDGRDGYSGDDVPATSASLWNPSALVFDTAGNLYIADRGNSRIRKVDPSGIITTVIGRAGGYEGDGGPASAARISQPRGLAIDRAGTLYISDTGNDRIRAILTQAPTFTLSKPEITFRSRLGGPPTSEQTVEIIGSIPGIAYSVKLDGYWLATTTPLSASAPGSLQLIADPDGVPEGTHEATVTVTAPAADPPVRTATVRLEVEPGTPPRLAAKPDALTFSAKGAQTIYLSNEGSTLAAFQATASGGQWLRVTPDSGSLNSVVPVPLAVSVDPQGLAPGTYSGNVTVDLAGSSTRIPVTLLVSAVPQSMLLSQTGLTFTAVERGGAVPPQSIGVLNLGRGEMAWQVASTADWLTVTPESGSTDGGALRVPLVQVGVRHTDLAPGDYYGQIRVTSATADNSPQIATVVLTVLPAGTEPPPVVRPTGLIFTMTEGGPPPGSQSVRVANLAARVTAFTSGRIPQDPENWFTHQPVDSAVVPDQPVEIVVQPSGANRLPAGVKRGTMTLQFADGRAQTVSLLLVVGAGAGNPSLRSANEGCVASRLLPVFSSLSSGFRVPAAWPTTIETKVVDDCGGALVEGTVVASFSNGDPPVGLTSLRDGRWVGTWQARRVNTPSVSVTVAATAPERNISGSAQLSGGLDGNVSSPLVERVNEGLVAPGGAVLITGSALATSEQSSSDNPLPTELGETFVAIGGMPVPLRSVSPGEIQGILPYEITPNARYPLIVQRGATFASSGLVTVAPAQPVVVSVERSGAELTIRATGLGAVDPPLPSGTVTPADAVHAAVNAVQVRLGDREAEVQSARLVAGEVGVYEIKATVPADAPDGDVVVSVATQTSAPARIGMAERQRVRRRQR